jgi:hypothetical protein
MVVSCRFSLEGCRDGKSVQQCSVLGFDESLFAPLLLLFFHLPREIAKLLGLFMARLYLQICELLGLLRQEQNQSLKLGRRLMRVVSLTYHQTFKFPD